MKFIILGSKIDSLINAYYLAKNGHKITIITNDNYKNIPNDIILFANEANILESKKQNLKSKILSIFSKNHNDNELNDLLTNNIISFKDLIKEEKLKANNQEKGLLYLYHNNSQKTIDKIDDYTNYKIFDIDDINKINLKSEYIGENLISAILSKNSFTIDQESFVNDLEKLCIEKYKIKFENNLTIKNILTNHKKITGIHTDKKVFVADQYLINVNSDNLNLLNSIKINIPSKNLYQLKLFTNENNISNKIKYNIYDLANNVCYYKNANHYKIQIQINKNDYENFSKEGDVEYFSKLEQLDILGIKDYKKIQHHLIKIKYFPNHKPMMQKSNKYDNLFLNAKFETNNSNFSFSSSKILKNILSQ